MQIQTDVLASYDFEGAYGMHGSVRVVRRGDKHYLVYDHFCGQDSPEGGMLREHVVGIQPDKVAEVVALVEDPWSDAGCVAPMTNHDYLLDWLLGDPAFFFGGGRKDRLKWATGL